VENVEENDELERRNRELEEEAAELRGENEELRSEEEGLREELAEVEEEVARRHAGMAAATQTAVVAVSSSSSQTDIKGATGALGEIGDDMKSLVAAAVSQHKQRAAPPPPAPDAHKDGGSVGSESSSRKAAKLELSDLKGMKWAGRSGGGKSFYDGKKKSSAAGPRKRASTHVLSEGKTCELVHDLLEKKIALDAEAVRHGAPVGRFADFVKDYWKSNPQIITRKQMNVKIRAAKESEIPFKGSFLGRFPLVSADSWTGDHPLERSRSVDVFLGTRARETLTLKRH